MNSTSQELFYLSLKKKRESQGIEIDEISEQTKINPKYFIEFEKGNFDILPQVYTRLFLRSYAIEIGYDPQKVLEEFEIHTTGKIKPKNIIKVTPKKNNTENGNDIEESFFPEDLININQKKIIGIVIAIVVLILLVWKLREITTDTTSGIEQKKIGNEQIEKPTETSFNTSNIPGSYLDEYKKIDQKAINLGISPPYTLSVISTVHSSIKLKIIENGVTTLDRILELKPAQILTRDSKGKLQFELKSTENLSISLNENDKIISQFLKPENISDDDLAIKVIVEEDGSLTAEYFKIN